MKYWVVIEQGPENYSAYVPDLPGCTSAGHTEEEVLANIREAIQGHLEVMCEYGDPVPASRTEAALVEVDVTV